MSVQSVPVTDVLPGDVVYKPDCGWREVLEKVPGIDAEGRLSIFTLILDHPTHQTSATQLLLGELSPCLMYVPERAKVRVQQ